MKARNIIFGAVLILVIGVLVALSVIKKNMPMNDDYYVGNPGGNLYNGGLFCEHDGKVYFANPEASGELYVMNSDESGVKKLAGVSVENINVDDHRVYYTLSGKSSGSGLGYIRKATGLFSIKKTGGDDICYTQDAVGVANLVGSYLYYQHYDKTKGTYLDKIRLDKTDARTVIEAMVNPASADSGYIYYAGVPSGDNNRPNAYKDMYLHMYDTRTGSDTTLYEHQMYQPIYDNGYIYYLDLETKYQLHRYSLSTGEDVTLTKERVDMFNVGGGMIYYQTDSSSPDAALKRMTTDGADQSVVATGIYCDINMTSNFVYFHSYESLSPMYHQSLRGGVNVMVFAPSNP